MASSSVPERRSRTHANSLSERLGEIRAGSSMARMGANSEKSVDIRAIVRELASELDLSQKAMATDAACAESDMSDGLKGKKRLDIQWVFDQDPQFVRALLERIARAYGFVEEAEDELIAEQLGRFFTQMMRAFARRRVA